MFSPYFNYLDYLDYLKLNDDIIHNGMMTLLKINPV
jgi:hypothetical protein